VALDLDEDQLDPDLSAQRRKLGPPTGEYQLPRD
jgi:hypothetical protein